HLVVGVRCFFSSRRRHTRFSRDWSSDVCSSDLRRRTAGSGRAGGAAAEPAVDARAGAVRLAVTGSRWGPGPTRACSNRPIRPATTWARSGMGSLITRTVRGARALRFAALLAACGGWFVPAVRLAAQDGTRPEIRGGAVAMLGLGP